MCNGWAKTDPTLALRPQSCFVSLSDFYLYQSYALKEEQDFSYQSVMVVAWFHKIMGQMMKS
jgi:hypothetical protein